MAQGKEVIIGINRDPQFGPVITFGLGGIYVEVLKDVSTRVLPLTKKQTISLIDSIKASAILHGVRKEHAVNIDAITDIIMRMGQLAIDHEQIQSIEINPLIVSPSNAVAVDVLCTLRPSADRKSQ